jgi:Nuclease-related domain
MRVEYLSDHAGRQLQIASEQLQTAQSDVYNLQVGLNEALGVARAARRAKPFWKRLLLVPTPDEREALGQVEQFRRQRDDAQSSAYQIEHTVEQRAAGVEGEHALTWGLSNLPDEWVMLRGYRNQHGEIDHLLVGPLGLWAVEVKRRPVRVHVTGDEWRYEKLDRWGNVVETGWATDRRGRSWARQANDAAHDLRLWLGHNGYQVPIHTAVMLIHERAQIGQCENLTVNLLATEPQQLVEEIWRLPSPLSPMACTEIVKLIRRDHHFHNQRRQDSRRPPRQS